MYQFLQTVFSNLLFLFSLQISLQFVFLKHTSYNIHHFFQTFSLVCFSQVLHFIRVEHRVGISWGLRWTSLLFNDVLKPLLACPSTLDADVQNLEDDDDGYGNIELDEF
jgi:hypothetical protein